MGDVAISLQKVHTRPPMRKLVKVGLVSAVLSALLASVVATAGAAPPPPPKFWSASRCENFLLDTYGGPHRPPLATGKGHNFHVGQAICVGTGGPRACRWTTGHRSRLYSEFRVFTRSPLNGGVVRSWTLATRARPGFGPVAHHAGDQYAGWPPDFYMSRTTLLASDATSARFRSIVAPIAARITQHGNASGCTGGS